MENVVVLLCKRGVHTAGVILSPSLRFAGLLVILKQKWSDLNEGLFLLYYALEGHPNCILASDDDFNVLYALALSCHICRVDVSISELGGSSRVCTSVDSCGSTLDVVGCDAHDSSSTVSDDDDYDDEEYANAEDVEEEPNQEEQNDNNEEEEEEDEVEPEEGDIDLHLDELNNLGDHEADILFDSDHSIFDSMENAVMLLCKRGVHTAGVILSPSLSFAALSCHIGRVDVFVTKLGGSSRVCNSVKSCRSTLDVLGCDAHDSSSIVSEVVDLLPSFAGHKTKPLKSDHWVNLIRGVGQEFPGGVVEFCDSLCQFSLYHGFKFFYERNDAQTVKATCSVTGCDWATYASNVVIFDNLIAELKEGGGDKVISFLRNLPNDNWCHAHFPGKRYGELTSNLVECFNNWIKDERHLPVTQLLDCIRLKLMEQMSNRRVCAMKWNGVCPVMDKKLAAAFNFSRSWTVTTSHANLFKVRCNPSVSVDIGLRTCSCGEWQINSFPCVHAVCALKKSGKNLNEYVDRYYFVDMYKEAYLKCINPVPTLSKADFIPTSDAVLLPPLTKRPPRRPRTERIPSKGFRTRKVTCSRCGKVGHHNKARCKEPLNH
ncbi:hypothetical protein Vadar_023028 [Vaccinium darrowii]|uniref:Uncharacterized protein n=1 Tax=Vaccinium darrowii TaxID=229202 RepID=A0ACB7XSB4_9ERIC|nr:hypothetical protein Vadar_023028 [Vaccinium darrowii]